MEVGSAVFMQACHKKSKRFYFFFLLFFFSLSPQFDRLSAVTFPRTVFHCPAVLLQFDSVSTKTRHNDFQFAQVSRRLFHYRSWHLSVTVQIILVQPSCSRVVNAALWVSHGCVVHCVNYTEDYRGSEMNYSVLTGSELYCLISFLISFPARPKQTVEVKGLHRSSGFKGPVCKILQHLVVWKQKAKPWMNIPTVLQSLISCSCCVSIKVNQMAAQPVQSQRGHDNVHVHFSIGFCKCYTLWVTDRSEVGTVSRKDFLHIEGLNSPGEKRGNISSY